MFKWLFKLFGKSEPYLKVKVIGEYGPGRHFRVWAYEPLSGELIYVQDRQSLSELTGVQPQIISNLFFRSKKKVHHFRGGYYVAKNYKDFSKIKTLNFDEKRYYIDAVSRKR